MCSLRRQNCLSVSATESSLCVLLLFVYFYNLAVIFLSFDLTKAGFCLAFLLLPFDQLFQEQNLACDLIKMPSMHSQAPSSSDGLRKSIINKSCLLVTIVSEPPHSIENETEMKVLVGFPPHQASGDGWNFLLLRTYKQAARSLGYATHSLPFWW